MQFNFLLVNYYIFSEKLNQKDQCRTVFRWMLTLCHFFMLTYEYWRHHCSHSLCKIVNVQLHWRPYIFRVLHLVLRKKIFFNNQMHTVIIIILKWSSQYINIFNTFDISIIIIIWFKVMTFIKINESIKRLRITWAMPRDSSAKCNNWWKQSQQDLTPFFPNSQYSYEKPRINIKVCRPFSDAEYTSFRHTLRRTLSYVTTQGRKYTTRSGAESRALALYDPQCLTKTLPRRFVEKMMRWNAGLALNSFQYIPHPRLIDT